MACGEHIGHVDCNFIVTEKIKVPVEKPKDAKASKDGSLVK